MSDDRGAVFGQPHWVDAPPVREPYLYLQGAFMKISYAHWTVRDPIPTSTYTVKGTGPRLANGDLIEIPPTGATLTGSLLEIKSTAADSIVATKPFPANEVNFYDPNASPFTITWQVSVDGGPYQPAGRNTNPIYVCLTGPINNTPILYRTTVHLACSGFGVFNTATNADPAFANTWDLIKHRNVNSFWGDAWILPLYYYKGGTTFVNNPQGNTARLLSAGTGECTCWTSLMIDACALNGAFPIRARATCNTNQFPDYRWFLVNAWTFNASTDLDPPIPPNGPWWWFWTKIPLNGALGEMVPPPDSNNPAVFRNLVNSIGAPGQNSPTPSEKLFGFHEFVKYSINGVIRYYDPSYGLEYANNVDFHNQAIAGYATGPRVDINPGFALYAVQKPNDNNGNPRVIIQIIP